MFERICRPNNLTKSLLPILLCNWIFGNQIIQYSYSHFIFLQKWWYFFFVISVYTISWIVTLLHELNDGLPLTYQEKIFWTVTVAGLLIFCINIILGLIYKKKSQIIFERSLKVDKKLEDFGVPVNYQRAFDYSLIVIIISAIAAFSINLMTIIWSGALYAPMESFTIFTLNHPIHINYIFGLTFCELARHMGLRFRKINKALKKFVAMQNNSDPITESSTVLNQTSRRLNHNLLTLKNIHLELTILCEKITDIFGVQLIMFMVSSFVLITFSSYNLYITNRDPEIVFLYKFYENFISLSWIIANIVNFQYINYIAAQTVNEWSQTGQIIHNVKFEAEDTDTCLTIRKFALQMLQNPLKFSPCGYVDLGFPFVRDFFGTIVTYLIIMIQMAPNPSDTA